MRSCFGNTLQVFVVHFMNVTASSSIVVYGAFVSLHYWPREPAVVDSDLCILPGPRLHSASGDGAVKAGSPMGLSLSIQYARRRIDAQQQRMVRRLRTVEEPRWTTVNNIEQFVGKKVPL